MHHLRAWPRLKVLPDEAQDTLNPLKEGAATPEGRVNHAADVPCRMALVPL
jgi:hypothetical protein